MGNSGRRYGPTVLVYCFVAVASALTEWLSFFVAARFASWASLVRPLGPATEILVDRRFTGGALDR